ncbi:hypothetical protein HC776_01080 [bacterium]|nr:hypothetical protein [bacterium]
MILPFFSLSPRTQLSLFGLMQVALLPALWGHISDSSDFLGRYSGRYGVVLIVHGLVLLLAAGGAWQAERLQTWLGRVPPSVKHGAILAAAALAFMVWFLPLEMQVRGFFALTLTQIAGLFILTLPDKPVSQRPFRRAAPALLIIFVVPVALTIYTALPYSPDEAHWADFASAIVRYGGLYTPSWARTPMLIEPGIGWSVAVYGGGGSCGGLYHVGGAAVDVCGASADRWFDGPGGAAAVGTLVSADDDAVCAAEPGPFSGAGLSPGLSTARRPAFGAAVRAQSAAGQA